MSNISDVQIHGRAKRSRPDAESEGFPAPLRSTRRGELVTMPLDRMLLSDQGAYFMACSAVPGTGLAGHAAPTDISVATKPHVYFKNNRSVGDPIRCYLDYIRLRVTVAGAGASDLLYALEGDEQATARYASGGTALVARNPNMDSSESPTVTIYAGAVVANAASTNARELGSGLVRNAVSVVGDDYYFDFQGRYPSMSNVISGTAPVRCVIPCPPVILGAGQQLLLHLAATSQSGAHSYEVDIGWAEL